MSTAHTAGQECFTIIGDRLFNTFRFLRQHNFNFRLLRLFIIDSDICFCSILKHDSHFCASVVRTLFVYTLFPNPLYSIHIFAKTGAFHRNDILYRNHSSVGQTDTLRKVRNPFEPSAYRHIGASRRLHPLSSAFSPNFFLIASVASCSFRSRALRVATAAFLASSAA